MAKYKLSLETLSWKLLVACFIFFFTFLAIFIIVGIWAPSQTVNYDHDMDVDEQMWGKFMTGDYSLEGTQSELQPLNIELYLSLIFFANEKISPNAGFQEDLLVNVTLFTETIQPNGKSPIFVPIVSDTHKRIINCHQKSELGRCSPMVVFHIKTLEYDNYKIKFTLLPTKNQKGYEKLFNRKLKIMMSYVNAQYSSFEIVFRYGFLVFNVVVLICFSGITFSRQKWVDWHTEQKWVFLLLVGLIFFNNPLYAFHYKYSSWFFPLLNVLFKSTFICILLLSFLIFNHAIYRTDAERTFSSFYLPKIGVVGSIWLLDSVANSWTYYLKHLDPVYSDENESSFYWYILHMSNFLNIIYICMLLYYIVRAALLYHTLPKKFSSKFVTVLGITIFVIVVTFVTLYSVSEFNLANPGLIMLGNQAVFNLYTCLLSFVFLPSYTKETITDYELEKQGMLSSTDE